MEVGYCRSCGQMVRLNQDYGSEEENNWEATGQCSCHGSRDAYLSYRRRETQIKNANESIDSLFTDCPPGVTQNAVKPDASEHAIALMRGAVVPVVDRLLHKVSIDIPGGVKVVISRSGKDGVSVERSDVVRRKIES